MKVVKPIIYGILASLGSLFFEMIVKYFSKNDFSFLIITSRLSWFLILAISIEELLKIILIYKYYQEIISSHDKSRNRKLIQGETFYSALLFGLGFSFLEIFFFTYDPAVRIQVAYLGILGVVFIHTITSGFIGYFLSHVDIIDHFVFLEIFVTIFSLHLLYNSLVIYNANNLVKFIYLFFICIFLFFLRYRQQRKA